MSEWWTYSLTSFLLFSARTYYRLFELYNADVWPLQVLTLALGLAILALIVRRAALSGRIIAAVLSALWLFVAWAYLLERYDPINFVARYFALGFVAQAALLIWTGLIRDRLRFDLSSLASRIGLALLSYALFAHPLIAPLSGRPWAQAEIFGIAPDPTAIATLGVLLAASRAHWHLVILPALWCMIAGVTLWAMESPEAPVAPLIAAIALALTARKSFNFSPPADG